MKWVIYQLVTPSSLKEISHMGYNQQIIYRDVLEKLDISEVEENHPTMEAAFKEIEDKKDKLVNLRLTVIPVLEVLWNGEISKF